MRARNTNLARLALRQQVEFLGGGQVSLDSLWRAQGSPHGHDPRTWSELAAPLLSGVATYLANLGRPTEAADEPRLLWVWRDESKDPWHSGDTMSHELVAWVYATYLDQSIGGRAATAANLSPAACS